MSNRFLVSAAVLLTSLAGTAYAAHPNVDTYDGMNRRVPARVDPVAPRDEADSHARVAPSSMDRYDGMTPVKPRTDAPAGRDRAGKPVRSEKARGTTRPEVQQDLRQWRADPTSPDGFKDLGGEAGAVYVAPARR